VVLQCGHSARTPSVITQFPHAARRVPFTAGLLYLPLQLNLLAGHGTSSLMSSTVLQRFCRCLSARRRTPISFVPSWSSHLCALRCPGATLRMFRRWPPLTRQKRLQSRYYDAV
jgi:hypothetical protein